MKITQPMRGLDNTVFESLPRTTSAPNPAAPLRRVPREHPIVVAVHEAEYILAAANEHVDEAVARHEANDVSHGDEIWDNGKAVYVAVAAQELAEEAVREAKRDYAQEFNRSWDDS